MRRKTAVELTHSFEATLEHLERFLGPSKVFDRLIDDLSSRVIPLLEQTPRLGTPFAPKGLNEEGQFLFAQISRRLGALEARQLVRGDFLILYVVGPRKVTLASVRHHRELGFRLTP